MAFTSDHGYIFFGAGFDSTRPNEVCAWLDQDRFKLFNADERMPNGADEPGLQVFDERRLAMLRGRIKNRPQGPAAIARLQPNPARARGQRPGTCHSRPGGQESGARP